MRSRPSAAAYLAAALLAFGPFLKPRPAHAAPPASGSPTPARPASSPRAAAKAPLADVLQGTAKDAYQSARILMNNGDAAGAIAKYQEAYDASKDPRLLFNMALCARSLRAYARMRGLLLRFEREGAPLTPDDKADVDAALAAIHNFVGEVRVSVTPDDAALTVDGERPDGPATDPLVLDLGKHTLAVTKPGYQALSRSITVQGGASSTETFALVPESHAAHLVVRVAPDAAVRVDEGAPAAGGFSGSVASGPHDLLVTAPGKLPYRAQVVLRDDETRSVDVTLEAEHHGAIWPWIAGGVAVAAGAAVGGYFLFRPHDHVAGVPDGSGGTVNLASFGRAASAR